MSGTAQCLSLKTSIGCGENGVAASSYEVLTLTLKANISQPKAQDQAIP